MKIWSLTYEKANKIRQELAEKTKALDDLEATSPTALWVADLTSSIEEALDERDHFIRKLGRKSSVLRTKQPRGVRERRQQPKELEKDID